MATTDQGTLSIPAPGMNPVNTSSLAQTNPVQNTTGVNGVSTNPQVPVVTAQPWASDYTNPTTYANAGFKYNPVSPTNQPVAITANSLATAPAPTVPATGNTASNTAQAVIGGAQGGAAAANDAYQSIVKSEQDKADAAAKNLNQLNPLLSAAGSQIGTRGQMQQQAEESAGVGIAKELARGLTQEYQTKQLAFNQVMQSIYNNPSISGALKADQLDNLSRQHAFDLTDLSIRQNIATGNYQALQDSVDKRVNLLYGDVKDKYDYLKGWYDENKGDLTKAEDNKLQIQIKQAADANAEVKDFRDTQAEMLKSAVSQNASQSVIEAISKATDKSGVINAAGEYAVDQLEREAKRANIAVSWANLKRINAETAKTLKEINPVTANLNIGDIDLSNPENIRTLPVSDLTKAAMAGTIKLKDLTPTDKAKVASEMYNVGFNPQQYVLNKIDKLISAWTAVDDGRKGLINYYTTPFAANRYDDVAKFESARTVLTREIARLNDVGVLSDQDVASYTDAMPSRKDNSLEVVRAKAAGIGTALNSQGQGGADIQNLSDDEAYNVYQDYINSLKK